MKRILPALRFVGRLLRTLGLLTIIGMNVLMGYIMFAPDELPKPFYLNYAHDLTLGWTLPFVTAAIITPTPTPAPVQAYNPGEGLMVPTGTKIVNLADPGGRRYLKAAITIEVAPPPGVNPAASSTATAGGGEGAATNTALTAFNDEMNTRMPVINDTLTTLLSSKTFESIYTMDGKEQLRLEILKTLNDRVPGVVVIAVYFTEFVVQ